MEFQYRNDFDEQARTASLLAAQITNLRVDYKGLYGYSILRRLPFFLIPRCYPMHTLGLGIMKDCCTFGLIQK
jgi:hypothetical protein